MYDIEPFYNWRNYYAAEEDEQSPFYGREYDVMGVQNRIYNYCINPQWDAFGSSTLYLKILFADYVSRTAVLELIGEWNDCLHNDIMYLKREVIEPLEAEGIDRFILIGENVLNFHASDDCYYEEWYEEITERGGWIAAINFRDHVRDEMCSAGLDGFLQMNGSILNWRTFSPQQFCQLVDSAVSRRLAS